jgi:hypothetical protein
MIGTYGIKSGISHAQTKKNYNINLIYDTWFMEQRLGYSRSNDVLNFLLRL